VSGAGQRGGGVYDGRVRARGLRGDFNDCDKDPANGCEKDGSCKCTPGEQIACYTGPPETQNKGKCKDGVCRPATRRGRATGVSGRGVAGPIDICANNLDDDCDGVDEDPDEDGDGWTVCGGDCCDAIGPNCLNPSSSTRAPSTWSGQHGRRRLRQQARQRGAGLRQRPGQQLERAGNDYAKAIDLCQFTVENPPQEGQEVGRDLVTTVPRRRGRGAAATPSRSATGFGTGGIVPQQNARLAVFSTGNAADQRREPGLRRLPDRQGQRGQQRRAGRLARRQRQPVPQRPRTCPGPGLNQAYNSIMLKIRVRVPTNAKSFNVQMYFFSAEWPEYVCTAFNDLFVTLSTRPAWATRPTRTSPSTRPSRTRSTRSGSTS
jgi:hypothetical protein